MGSRVEILNAGGFRADGRKQYELRDMSIDLSTSEDASRLASSSSQRLTDPSSYPHPTSPDGAAHVCHGLTEVSVRVFGPREAKLRRETIHDRANTNVQIMMVPFSGGGGGRRRGRGDKRLLELGAAIKSTFESVIQIGLYPRSQIDIIVDIHQQDGGVLQAAINATTLALIDAGVALFDYVVAVSAGLHSTSILLDLTNTEESDLPHLTVAVMPRSGKVTLLNMESRLHVTRFEDVLKVAGQAAEVLREEMGSVVRRRSKALISSMESAGAAQGTAGAGGYGDDMDL